MTKRRPERTAEKARRELEKLKASHVRTEHVTRCLAEIEDLAGRKLEQALEAAAPSLAECRTEAGCAAILEAAMAPLLAELDRLEAEARTLPTLADEERRRRN